MKGDLLAGTLLTDRYYGQICKHLQSLDCPVAALLEGGYDPNKIAKCSVFGLFVCLFFFVSVICFESR